MVYLLLASNRRHISMACAFPEFSQTPPAVTLELTGWYARGTIASIKQYFQGRFLMDDDMSTPFSQAARLERLNIPFAMVTLTRAEGTTPRDSGRMLVSADGNSYGTIGGGAAEAYAISQAVRMMTEGLGGPISYPILSADGKSAVGEMGMFVDVVSSGRKIILLGGGHVNLAVAKLASQVGYEVELVEVRPEFATAERFPMASRIHLAPTIREALRDVRITSATAVVVASHTVDYETTLRLLDSPAVYIGMLGSRRKARDLNASLSEAGIPAERLARLFTPIGLDLGAETPAQIAVAVVAEIMQVMNDRGGGHLRDVSKSQD